MGDGFYLFDIILFAMIAGFIVYRLRSVLGRRHGEEKQRPNPFGGQRGTQRPGPGVGAGQGNDNVVHLPERGRGGMEMGTSEDGTTSLAAGVTQIKVADPSFSEKGFLQGAKGAFEMIVAAFAKGDTETLKPLLSDDVYDNFADAIRDRERSGESLETSIEDFKDADLLEARMKGQTAYVTVKFVTEQINVTRDESGDVIDGNAEKPEEVVDIWTFARNTRSRDPNWMLVETRTPN